MLFAVHKRIMEKLIFTTILILISGSSYAQSDSSRVLKEVKINASFIPKVQSLNPSQQISSTDFKRNNAFNVADAIRNFSGVNIKDYGGIGGLKTVSVRSLGANHTGVQYDGIQVADAQNGQVDLGKINLDNIASITLFNGQSGDILQPARSFSSASVLIIKSITPHFEGKNNHAILLTYKTGAFGLINPSLLWQQKISENWSFSLSNNWQKANGRYKYRVEGDGSDTLAVRNNADLNALQNDASLYWKGKDSSSFHFRVNYANANRGLPGAVVFYNPYTNQHLWNRDMYTQASFNKTWKNSLSLLLNGKLSTNYLRYLDPDYLNQAGFLDQRYTQFELYQSVALSFNPVKNWRVSIASDVAINKLNTNLYNYAYPTRFTFLNVLASSLKLQKLTLQANFLNTYIKEKVQTGNVAPSKMIWSPAFSLSYEPFDFSGFQLRAFYKDIFRNPTFNDLYYTRMGSRSLKPEFTKQYNLGITYSKAYAHNLNYLTLTADAYYNKVKDKIIAIPTKDLFTWTMLNLGQVDIRGLDLGLKTQISIAQEIKFVFSANYTFQKAIDVTDRESSVYLHQIPYTPQHTLALNTGFNKGAFGIYYNQIMSSSRYYLSENRPENFVPGFTVSDVSLNYQFAAGGYPLSFSTEINNVFNQSYAFIRSFPMPGRTVRLSFQIKI